MWKKEQEDIKSNKLNECKQKIKWKKYCSVKRKKINR